MITKWVSDMNVIVKIIGLLEEISKFLLLGFCSVYFDKMLLKL